MTHSATGVNGNQSSNSAQDSGATYVFVRNGNNWSQQAYLKASNTDAIDLFGTWVSVSGNTVVVGAPGERSNATGVNGNQSSNSSERSGAAYVFVRSGTSWSQQAYLKASNTDAFDRFGQSVAVSGDTVVVGAHLEDSNATGVGGNQADNSAGASGAAYVFARSGIIWRQDAYLKASNSGASDLFGRSVSVSGDTVIVGADDEDSNATGVNGNQADTSASEAGAAYVFAGPPGPWTDEGCALAGITGPPVLIGTGTLAGGATNSVDLSNAAPFRTAGLFFALSSTPIPFKGGTLCAFPNQTLFLLSTNFAGEISIPFILAPGLPAGTEMWLQWAIQDAAAVQGVSLSNAIKGVTQ